jgi:hypothetical protein
MSERELFSEERSAEVVVASFAQTPDARPDAVFGVKRSLVREFEIVDDPARAAEDTRQSPERGGITVQEVRSCRSGSPVSVGWGVLWLATWRSPVTG